MQKNKKRSDGRLQARVYIGNANGKHQYKYVYARNQKELDKKIQEVKTRIGKGLDLSAERDTFGYWAEKWLKLKRSEVSAGRYTTYEARMENLRPLFDLEISKLRVGDFQEIISDCASEPCERTKKPYSHATLLEIKSTASQIMKFAIDNRIIDYNPVTSVKVPKETRKTEMRRALTDEEQQWIINTPHRAQTAAMVMMYAGLRRGELLALTWSDIDLKAKTISVNKSAEIINNQTIIKNGGKTKAAIRIVYIPQILVDYLSGVPGVHFGYVVCKEDGQPMTDSAWKRLWDSYLDDLNLKYGDWSNCIQTHGKRPNKYGPRKKPMIIPRFTAHWLRHTFITLMYMSGVDILTAKEQAGHADIETTMSIYTHLDNQYKKKNIEKMNDYINDKLYSEAEEKSAEN